MENICKNCKYWKPDNLSDEDSFHQGDCRFNPPQVSNEYNNPWPMTKPDDLCSQFTAKNK